MTQNSLNTQNFRACGADEILKVIIYYMTCEKHAMVFLPPEAKILTILKCFHRDFAVKINQFRMILRFGSSKNFACGAIFFYSNYDHIRKPPP